MRITLDTEKKIFIVPNTFYKELDKQNAILKKAGVSDDKLITDRKFIEEAIAEAFENPINRKDQAKVWDSTLKNQMAK